MDEWIKRDNYYYNRILPNIWQQYDRFGQKFGTIDDINVLNGILNIRNTIVLEAPPKFEEPISYPRIFLYKDARFLYFNNKKDRSLVLDLVNGNTWTVESRVQNLLQCPNITEVVGENKRQLLEYIQND